MRFMKLALAVAVFAAVAAGPPLVAAQENETMMIDLYIDDAGSSGALPAAAMHQGVMAIADSRALGFTSDNELHDAVAIERAPAMLNQALMEMDTGPASNASNMNAIYLGAGHNQASRVDKRLNAAPANSAGNDNCWVEYFDADIGRVRQLKI